MLQYKKRAAAEKICGGPLFNRVKQVAKRRVRMKEKWFVAAKKANFQAIAAKFGIDQVTARLIRNRDVVGTRQWKNTCTAHLSGLAILPG